LTAPRASQAFAGPVLAVGKGPAHRFISSDLVTKVFREIALKEATVFACRNSSSGFSSVVFMKLDNISRASYFYIVITSNT